MKTKSVLAALLLMLSVSTSFAQKFCDKFEVNAGLNVASMSQWADNSMVGFHAGVRGTTNMDNVITKGVYINYGALLSMKGWKQDLGDLGLAKSNAFYLDIPVHMGYKYDFKTFSVFGEFGPFFDFGLFGNQTSKNLVNIFTKEFEEESFSAFEMVKRFDFGLGFRVGAEFKKFNFALGYDFGLINAYKGRDNVPLDIKYTTKTRNFYIGLGYIF